ncbi:hypothetical protein PGT21_007619 [Puccinia graminis f. sp. tritici]|uniref:Secreted protein n=1 Tax=Puccinia graminis f. sp. tritici TaxID=56615 RepID=A0A5B0S0M7_PUCGR|nr:hypothetical protein PGT21_007619 [Puccinia graminis f. sp. tritici]KAA1131407.1 hypothetical protein PGTUg99_004502 [Puccinia graminis f. sp. tritici]
MKSSTSLQALDWALLACAFVGSTGSCAYRAWSHSPQVLLFRYPQSRAFRNFSASNLRSSWVRLQLIHKLPVELGTPVHVLLVLHPPSKQPGHARTLHMRFELIFTAVCVVRITQLTFNFG